MSMSGGGRGARAGATTQQAPRAGSVRSRAEPRGDPRGTRAGGRRDSHIEGYLRGWVERWESGLPYRGAPAPVGRELGAGPPTSGGTRAGRSRAGSGSHLGVPGAASTCRTPGRRQPYPASPRRARRRTRVRPSAPSLRLLSAAGRVGRSALTAALRRRARQWTNTVNPRIGLAQPARTSPVATLGASDRGHSSDPRRRACGLALGHSALTAELRRRASQWTNTVNPGIGARGQIVRRTAPTSAAGAHRRPAPIR
jgi:hypothetical protein